MIGQTISHYRILNTLGSGGMGDVYLAVDERLGRNIALKILHTDLTGDPERARRFEQEARAASALNHPNIVTIHDIGHIMTSSGDLYFIATEYIEGETLRMRLNATSQWRRLEIAEAIEIAIQCCGALNAAHKAGIIHRDIKPENIMLRPDGYVKILDFGIAKLIEQYPQETGPNQITATKSLFHTQPGMVMGTVAYMSPEQARGQRVDGRSDVFSLGVTLYEMIAGRRPFTGPTISDMIAALLLTEPQRLSQQLHKIPGILENIVSKMLAKDPNLRYLSAQEALDDLRRAEAQCQPFSERPIDHSACYDTSIMVSADLWPPSDNRLESNASPQAGFETNIIPLTAQPGLPTEEQMSFSDTQSNKPYQSRPRQLKLRWLAAAALACLTILLALTLGRTYLADRKEKLDSIAILPFMVSNGRNDNYLSEGIAETIINTLSQFPELSVSSRNSVIKYKGRRIDARDIGVDLKVKAALLGEIRRSGKELNIIVELVDTRDGNQIWGDTFNFKPVDLLAVQDKIMCSVASKLELRSSQDQESFIAAVGTRDSEAYDLYLKGRSLWNEGTIKAIAMADAFFEKAAGKDPSYALAFAGCAASHAAGSDGLRPQDSMQKARRVAAAALKVNNNLLDARLTLADVNLRYDWDFASAEREFKQAVQLNPKRAVTHHRYAEFLALMGRYNEASEELDTARRLDQNSIPINTTFGAIAYYSGDFQEALRRLKRTLELDDNSAPLHARLGLTYEQQGNTQDAILSFLRAGGLRATDQVNTATLRRAFATQGRDAFWKEYLAQLIAESKKRYVPKTAIAAAQVRLGRNDQALDALAEAVKEKDPGVVELKVERVFDPLRSTPKFNALLRRIGLQP